MGDKETPEEGKQQVRPKVALEGKGHIPKSLPSLRPAVKPKVQRGTHTCPAAVDNAINTPLFQDYPRKGCLPLQRTPLLPSPHPQGPKCPLYSRPGGGQGVLLGSTFPLRVYLAMLSNHHHLQAGTAPLCTPDSAVEEQRKGCQPCWIAILLDASRGSRDSSAGSLALLSLPLTGVMAWASLEIEEHL